MVTTQQQKNQMVTTQQQKNQMVTMQQQENQMVIHEVNLDSAKEESLSVYRGPYQDPSTELKRLTGRLSSLQTTYYREQCDGGEDEENFLCEYSGHCGNGSVAFEDICLQFEFPLNPLSPTEAAQSCKWYSDRHKLLSPQDPELMQLVARVTLLNGHEELMVDVSRVDVKCRNGALVDYSLTCDAHDDCGDGSDEHECGDASFFTYDSFSCKRNPETISSEQFCDGIPDCHDGTDEEGCISEWRFRVDMDGYGMAELIPKDENEPCPEAYFQCEADFFRGFLWTLSALAVTGNVGVFIYRLFLESAGTSPGFRVLVANLCFSDFLMGVYLMMIGSADVAYRGRYLWEYEAWTRSAVCHVAGFLALASSDWEFYSQTGICLPLPITQQDFPGQQYAFGVFIVLNFGLFALIGSGQLLIYRAIRSTRMAGSTRDQQQDMTIARRLFLIVISDFCCWFPIGLMGLLAARGTPIPGVVNVWSAIFVLPLNSALNPFLYTLATLLERRRKLRRTERVQRNAGKTSRGDQRMAKGELEGTV
nr:hypothetical protein BaRGS_006860 [Batillaria attramentaria]